MKKDVSGNLERTEIYDIIYGEAGDEQVVQYNKGDGNDANDTIKINKSDYVISTEGTVVKISVEGGAITLMDSKCATPKIVQTDEDIFPVGVTADKKKTTLTVSNKFRGANIISGGTGNDTLVGDKGKDIFVYESESDFIDDYKSGQDKIKLVNAQSLARLKYRPDNFKRKQKPADNRY